LLTVALNTITLLPIQQPIKILLTCFTCLWHGMIIDLESSPKYLVEGEGPLQS
jgi:hypothetical protein